MGKELRKIDGFIKTSLEVTGVRPNDLLRIGMMKINYYRN